MLHLLRNKGLSSAVYGVVIVGTVAAFAINFGPGGSRQKVSFKDALREDCAVKVGSACVDPKTHRAAYRLLTPVGQTGERDINRARSMGLWRIVVDGLVERELLIREANRVGLTVSESEVTDSFYDGFTMVSLPSDNPTLAYSLRVPDGRIYLGFRDRKSKQFTEKAFRDQLRMYMGLTPNEFKEWQERELLARKMRDLIKAPVRISEQEALSSYTREKSTATMKYVEVTHDFVARYVPAPTAAELDKFAKDETNKKKIEEEFGHAKESFAPKPNHIRHILVKVSPTAGAEEKAKAAQKMGQAWARLQGKASFASVASEFSEDTSAAMGGDVGDKTDGFVAPFKKAADALKAGEVTAGAIETQFGWHVIMKDDPSKATDVESSLKQDITRKMFLESKRQEAAKDLALRILTPMKAGKSEEEAIKEALTPFLKVKVETASAFKVRKLGAPAASGADAGAPPTDAGAEEVWSETTVTPSTTPATEASDRPQVRTSSPFNRGGDPIASLGGQGATKLNEFAFSAKPGEIFPEAFAGESAFVITRLFEQKQATKADFEKDRDTYMQEGLAAKQAEALVHYSKRLKDAAKSEIKLFEEKITDAKADGGAPEPDEEP